MYRYVAVRDDEEIGIFHILDLFEEQDMTPGDAGDLDRAERTLEILLPIPEYPENRMTRAWFTDHGMEVFGEPVGILCALSDKYLEVYGYKTEKRCRKYEPGAYYEDEYRVVYIITQKRKKDMSMHVNCDLYADRSDMEDTVKSLVNLCAEAEKFGIKTGAVQEAIDILYDVMEGSED